MTLIDKTKAHDDDLIRRGDALYAIAGWEIPSTAIAALPAVTRAPDAAALSATEIDDSKTPDPVAYAAGYAAALREAAAIATARWAARREHADRLAEMDYPEAMIDAKTVSAKADEAEMIAEQILALIPKGSDSRLVYMGQIMAECDCPREAECQAAGLCIAEGRR